MLWDSTYEYSAKIGGIIYKNVKKPITLNGKSLIYLSRNRETSELGASLKLEDENGNVISEIKNNKIIYKDENFYTIEGMNRICLRNKDKENIYLDLKYNIDNSDFEIELSAIMQYGSYPIILHPDRTKFGCINDSQPPNISSLHMTTDSSFETTAVSVENGEFYMLGITIENFTIGIDYKLGEKIAAN